MARRKKLREEAPADEKWQSEMEAVTRVGELFKKYVGDAHGASLEKIDQLYDAIQREKQGVERRLQAAPGSVSPGLLTELRSELSEVTTLRKILAAGGHLGRFGKVDVTRNFRRERKRSPSSCAAGSFRAKKTRNGALLTFCCPKGKYNKRTGTCRVGMVMQSLGRPRRRRR